MIETIIKWGLLGLFVLFLLIGFLVGIIRGLKRSGLHIIFVVVSVVLSLLLTKTVTNLILGINIPIGGHPTTISQYIFDMINSYFDLSAFSSVADLITVLPLAAASPFVFMILQMVLQGLCGIVYLIVARVSFGKKKEDFKAHKPHRLLGGLVGAVEGFALMFIIFSPITSLGKTANDILYNEASTSSYSVSATDTTITTPEGNLKTVGEIVSGMIPGNVENYLKLVNDSVLSKVCSVAGLNHSMFDYLSTVKVNGEKVVLRKEFADTVEAYDNFTVVYNAVKDQDFSISGAKLEKSANKVVNAGIFKSVVAPVIRDFVVNYEEVKASWHLNVPAIAEEVVANLQPIFSAADFDPYEYLSHDIKLVVETAKSALDDGLAEKVYNMTTSALDIENVLTFTKQNETALSTDIKNLLNLNMLDANFDLAMDKVTQIVQEKLEDDTIKFNRNLTDKNAMVDQLFSAVDKIDSINTKVGGIKEFMEDPSNIIVKLAEIDNIGQTLLDIGTAIDDIRELEIIVVTEGGTTTYMFDKVLDKYGVDLLGDEVYGYPGHETTHTALDTYTKFVTYLQSPAQKAQDLGMLNALVSDPIPVEEVFNSVLNEIEQNPEIFNQTLLPFHEVHKQNLNTSVFDKVIDVLEDAAGELLDFTDVEATNTYAEWKKQFSYIGNTLKHLNSGAIEDGGETLTCLEYVLRGSPMEFDVLMKEMLGNITEGKSQFAHVVENAFASSVFKNLTESIFEEVDKAIKEVTEKDPHSNMARLHTDENVIPVLENMLNAILNAESIGLTEVGQVLDALKADAQAQGMFENIFNDLIWFVTGDTMGTPPDEFSGTPNNDYYEDVKAYINPTGTANYYTINYTQKFAELQRVVDFAQDLNNALSGHSLDTPEHAQEFIDAFVETINNMTGTTEEKVEILNDMKTLITNNTDREELLTASEKATYGATIVDAVEDQNFDEDLENAIYNLLGIEP